MTEFENGPEQVPKKPNQLGLILLGLVLSLFTPLLLLLILIPLNAEIFYIPLMFIGLSQLVYILPLVIYFHKKRMGRMVQGLIIGAAIVFLLNASCFGMLMTTKW